MPMLSVLAGIIPLSAKWGHLIPFAPPHPLSTSGEVQLPLLPPGSAAYAGEIARLPQVDSRVRRT